MNKTEEDVFRVYQETFKGIYADLVVTAEKKPAGILEQLEHCFSHFAVAKTSADHTVIQENINRAYGHIVRASLDAAKLLWSELRERAEKFVTDEEIRRFCINTSVGVVYSKLQNAERLSLRARRSEIENIGIDPELSIAEWCEATLAYQELYDLIDLDRVKQYQQAKPSTS